MREANLAETMEGYKRLFKTPMYAPVPRVAREKARVDAIERGSERYP